jgi:hypothetical protein
MNSRFTDESLGWRKLCRTAALEQDPTKLSEIVQRINSALRVRQRKLRSFMNTTRVGTSRILDRAA